QTCSTRNASDGDQGLSSSRGVELLSAMSRPVLVPPPRPRPVFEGGDAGLCGHVVVVQPEKRYRWEDAIPLLSPRAGAVSHELRQSGDRATVPKAGQLPPEHGAGSNHPPRGLLQPRRKQTPPAPIPSPPRALTARPTGAPDRARTGWSMARPSPPEPSP